MIEVRLEKFVGTDAADREWAHVRMQTRQPDGSWADDKAAHVSVLVTCTRDEHAAMVLALQLFALEFGSKTRGGLS